MTPLNLLDEALKKYKTDAAICRALGVSDAYISVVRRGDKKLSPLQTAKLAGLLGHSELKWVLIALREQARAARDSEYWQSLIEKEK